eukprot:1650699-Rhodomonas_salina.1
MGQMFGSRLEAARRLHLQASVAHKSTEGGVLGVEERVGKEVRRCGGEGGGLSLHAPPPPKAHKSAPPPSALSGSIGLGVRVEEAGLECWGLGSVAR